jgi:DNA uptake protein ComE-like DNA-binding protein
MLAPPVKKPARRAKKQGVVMNVVSAAAAALSAALFLASANPAGARTQQELMKVCADEWNDLKSANKTVGKVYQDFVKECLAKHKAAGQLNASPSAATSKVNLNTATAAELDRLPQIGATRAQAIIAARAKARFKSWDDFVARKVVPLSAEAAIKDLVGF